MAAMAQSEEKIIILSMNLKSPNEGFLKRVNKYIDISKLKRLYQFGYTQQLSSDLINQDRFTLSHKGKADGRPGFSDGTEYISGWSGCHV